MAGGDGRKRGLERNPGKVLGRLGSEGRLAGDLGGSHLARLLVHVEGADDALGDLAARALH